MNLSNLETGKKFRTDVKKIEFISTLLNFQKWQKFSRLTSFWAFRGEIPRGEITIWDITNEVYVLCSELYKSTGIVISPKNCSFPERCWPKLRIKVNMILSHKEVRSDPCGPNHHVFSENSRIQSNFENLSH